MTFSHSIEMCALNESLKSAQNQGVTTEAAALNASATHTPDPFPCEMNGRPRAFEPLSFHGLQKALGHLLCWFWVAQLNFQNFGIELMNTIRSDVPGGFRGSGPLKHS